MASTVDDQESDIATLEDYDDNEPGSSVTKKAKTEEKEEHKEEEKKEEKETSKIFKVDDIPQLKYLSRYVIPKVSSMWYKLGLELFDDKDFPLLDNIEANHPKCETCCMEMFKLWRKKNPKGSWQQLLDALEHIHQKPAEELLKHFHITSTGLSPPNNVRATAISHSSIEVTWDQSSDATEYTILYSTTASHISGGSVTVKGTRGTLGGLVENTPYVITVQAMAGNSKKSAVSGEVSVITPVAVPGSPPQNITIVRTDPASLKVSWQPPLESYNVPFTGYVIQYVKDGSQDMIKDIKNIGGTTHTISGLAPCTKYSIKVAAMNVDKTGPFSEPVVEISGEDVPSEPCILREATVTSTTVTLKWIPPETPNGVITRYSVQYGERVINKFGSEALNSLTGTVEGLSPNTSYVLQLTAHTRVGPGPPASLSVKTAATMSLYESKKLKARYKRALQEFRYDWPKHTVSKYIKLALIEKEEVTLKDEHLNEITKFSLKGSTDKILKKKRPLGGLKEIFHYGNQPCPRLILIMGGPGIGKTTLANEICIKWAKEGFLADDFDAVILILLREVQKTPLEVMIEKLFGEEDYKKLKQSIGEKCLIILEGLDELSTDQQKSAFFTDLMKCYIFEEATILITSRPHACTNLIVDRKIEVIGFGKAEIEEFAKESLGDGAEFKNFQCQLKDRPYLLSLCYVPLSLVMIVDIFKSKQSTLPSTLTKLYQYFIVMILRRPCHIKKATYSVAKSSSIEAQVYTMLENIPTEAVKMVCALSELAYHSFFGWCSTKIDYKSWGKKRDPKIIFTVEDLKQCGFHVTDDFDGFGLLKATYVHEFAAGDSCTYNFVHLSIQECLCAVYIATLPAEEQLQIYKKHRYHDAYHNMFALYSGVTQLSCKEVHEEVFIDLTEWGRSPAAARRLIYESQSGPPQSASLFTFENTMVPFLPYDILCISYVLSHYPVTKLNMQYSHLDDEQIELLANGYKSSEALKILDLNNNGLTSEGMKHVMKIITRSPSFIKLDVTQNSICDEGMLVIANDFQHYNTLTELLVENCNLSAKGIEYIKQSLPMLKYLDISQNSIGDDGLRHIMESLESSNSMLTELHMQRCRLSDKGIIYLKILLEKSKRLQCLNVSYNSIGNDGVKCIKDGLEQNNTLIKLNISSCDVKGDGNIKEIVERNTKLKCLDISDNTIGDDGVQHITQGLQDNDGLTELNMSSCHFSAEVADCIKKIIMKDTIQSLIIGGNRIRDNGMKPIAEGFQHNHSLTILKIHRCLLTEKGAITISEMIKDNYTLQCLDIRDNRIGDKGIEAIAQQLAHTRIMELDVLGCGFTDTGAKSLADGIRNNQTIGILNVLYNYISLDGAHLILEATIANNLCWWVGINREFIDADIKLKRMMNIIEMRRGKRVSSDDSDDD